MEGDTATQAVEGGSQAVLPPSGESNAADGGITAPSPQESAREAFARLERGERPEAVNQAVYGAKPSTPGKQDATPADSQERDGSPARQDAAPQPGQWPEGMDPKAIAVLKRAHFDPESWAAIPATNQKKVIEGLKKSQAAADREFQQRRAAEGKGQPDGTDAAGAAQTQVDPNDQDEATQQGQASNPGKGGQAAGAQQQQEPAQAGAGEPLNLDALIDPADLATLRELGGEDLAQIHARGVSRAVQAVRQQFEPVQNLVNYLLESHVSGQFDGAFAALAETPGMDKLDQEQKDAVKDRATVLMKAAGGPRNLSFKEAVQTAAHSLFKTNINQAAQAALLNRRKASLQGSPDRANGRRQGGEPLSGKERNRAIFAELQKGKSPDEARMLVDGD